MLCIKTFSRTTLEFGEKGIHKLPYLFKHDFFVNLKYIYLLTCSYLSNFLNFSLKELRNCISFLSRAVIILFRTGLCKSVLIFFGKLGYRVSVFFAFCLFNVLNSISSQKTFDSSQKTFKKSFSEVYLKFTIGSEWLYPTSRNTPRVFHVVSMSNAHGVFVGRLWMILGS